MFKTILIKLRKDRGLTQEELAKLLDLSRSALSLYELGKREPDFSTLKKFAEFFNVTTDYLLGRTASPQVYYIDNIIGILSEEEQRYVIENKPYIKLVKEISGKGLSPDKVRELLRVAMELDKE